MESAATEAGPVTGEPAAKGHTPPGAGSRLRAWTVGRAAGLAQALGVAVLLITEFVRQDVAALGGTVPKGTRLPDYAADFPHLMDTLDGQWWFTAAEAVRDAISFGEPRAALWAAVCAALVVRLNPDGPPRTQCFLSLAGACYCLVATLSALPFLALAGAALPAALLVGVLAIVLASAAPEAWPRMMGCVP
ncbi:hypothetical protein ITI46_32625 [Streptomyces oryzae]|uniref:Uncharacterized protein n=1 Tax=Streptomyces oryzae TaxID=1434886 RepID=A0ABS3XM01_9ACTN|nr:hypothetical protein [Streptomyces oryzae]MBO8196351.1 hypothetical protein [Streptomyces oryzae]